MPRERDRMDTRPFRRGFQPEILAPGRRWRKFALRFSEEEIIPPEDSHPVVKGRFSIEGTEGASQASGGEGGS